MSESAQIKRFRKYKTFEQRRKEYESIVAKYPERVPVIIDNVDDNLPHIEKRKYIVPRDLKFAELIAVIRKRINLGPEKAIFIFTENNTIPPNTELVSSVYEKNKSSDGFLYINVTGENTFG